MSLARVLRFGMACLLLAVQAFGQDVTRPKQGPAVTLASGDLPVPPKQTEKWTPPVTKLPETLLSTTHFLFDHGCADPRGCEYREVTVPIGSPLITTHAWVLPETREASQRFAICWNGLVYPVAEVRGPASLAEDCEEPGEGENIPRAVPEYLAVKATNTRYLRVCFLLRLGEVELAEKYWRNSGINPMGKDPSSRDPFAMLAGDWTWMAFDRAVAAHMRGDHRVSLAMCDLLSKHREAIEAELARRGFKLDGHWTYLSQVERLLMDQQRRVKQGPVERVLAPDAPPIQDAEKRIAALIRDLEDVDARQWGQPGGVSLGSHRVPEALKKEGAAAVEPLIQCLESDRRLTRSVSYFRDFHRSRNLLGVDAAAYATLRLIMETSSFGPLTEHGYGHSGEDVDVEKRRAVAAEIRNYWKARGNVSQEEQWFVTLQDDRATAMQWEEAAGRITLPADVTITDGWVATPHRPSGKTPPIRGEALRSRKAPSVADLLEKRSNEIVARVKNSSGSLFDLKSACSIAVSLAMWDSKAAVPTLRLRINDCIKALEDRPYGASNTLGILGEPLAQLATSTVRCSSCVGS